MATLKEMNKKLAVAAASERINVFKGEKNQILIDLNGDGEPEAALIDTTGNDRADLLAIDVTGDHKFNLFLDDTDDNAFPDVVYIDKKGDGNYQLLGTDEVIKGEIQASLVKIYAALTNDESDEDKLSDTLHDLAKVVKKLRERHANK